MDVGSVVIFILLLAITLVLLIKPDRDVIAKAEEDYKKRQERYKKRQKEHEESEKKKKLEEKVPFVKEVIIETEEFDGGKYSYEDYRNMSYGQYIRTEKYKYLREFKKKRAYNLNYTCEGCGSKFRLGKLQVDHIVPQYYGGSSQKENLQVLCVECNEMKGTKSQEEFKREIKAKMEKREKKKGEVVLK